MDGDALARAIGDLELRRPLAVQISAEVLQQVDQLSVLQLRDRGQLRGYAAPLDPNEFDASVGCLPRLLEEVGVTGEQGAQILLSFRLGRTLCRGAHFRRESDPALLIGAFRRDRDVHVGLLAGVSSEDRWGRKAID